MQHVRPLPPVLLALLTSATCLILANLYFCQPILLEIASDIGLAQNERGLIVTVTQVGYMVGLLLLAPLGDVMENRRLIALMVAGLALSLLLAASSTVMWLFLGAMFSIGLFAVATQVVMVFGSGLAQANARGRILGILGAGLFSGIALSRPFASFIASSCGWRTLYFGASLSMLGFAIVLYRFLPTVKIEGKKVSFVSLLFSMAQLLLKEPLFIERVTLSSGAFFAFTMYWSTVPLHLIEDLHFTHAEVALFALAGLVTPPAVFLAGRVLDKGLSFVLLVAVEVMAALTWSMSAAAPLSVSILLLTALCIDPAGSVSTIAIQQSVLASATAQRRGRINSLNLSINFCGGALGAALGPWAYASFGWPATASIGAVAMLGLLAINLWRRPTVKQITKRAADD